MFLLVDLLASVSLFAHAIRFSICRFILKLIYLLPAHIMDVGILFGLSYRFILLKVV